MYLSCVGGVWSGVAFFFYLSHSLVGSAVELELEDEDVLLRFYYAVSAPLALLLLCQYEVGADDAEDEIERVVEIALALLLRVLATHGVRNAGEECCELAV